jgi:glycosyltransferase 2 family protein
MEPTTEQEAGPTVPAAPAPLVVVDSSPARIRTPLDLVRLCALVLIVLALAGLGTIGSNTSSGATEDVSSLLNDVPHVFIRALSLAGTFGALALPFAFMVREIIRGQPRRLIEALVTGLLAIAVTTGLDWVVTALPSQSLYDAFTRTGHHSGVRPLDAYLAALLAFVTVAGAAREPIWRWLFALATALYVVSAFTAGQASLLSLVSSLVIGMTVGVAVRYIAGNANERPDGQRIAAELGRRDITLVGLRRVVGDDDDHRTYQATTDGGDQLTVHVLDRDLIASGAVYSVYRLLRFRAEISAAQAISMERVAERRTLLAMLAAEARVPTPRLVAGVSCGPDAIVLAYSSVVGVPLTEPTDAQLNELWSSAARLHHNRVTHHGLTATSLLVDPAGHVLLPIPTDGYPFATDLRISLDRAQLLVTTAQLVGADRAVHSARLVLSDDQLASTLPVLQPIAIARDTRTALKKLPGLLDEVRDQIQDQTNHPPPELSRVERFQPRTVITIVAVIVAVYLLVGQLGTVDLATVFRSARWRWVPLVAVASVATYFAAALSLTGYVRERLSFLRTVLVQVAASFAGFVTPPSVGGLAVNIRYLRKANVSTTGAATSVGLSQVLNAVSHVLLLIVFAAATGTSAHNSLPIPGWAFVAIGGVVAAILVVLALPVTRRWLLARLLPPLREALPRLLNLVTDPIKLAEAVAGTFALNGAYIAALWCAARAFDGRLDFAAVAVIYLAGAAIASAAPTPGGLGAVEVALSTGLAAAGMASAAAISAVLLFRLLTFWLPVPFGWAALHWLQRRDAL